LLLVKEDVDARHKAGHDEHFADAALFPIRLGSVRKERIGIAQISAGQFLTTRLLRVARMSESDIRATSPPP
jgi:hypothetical protein